MGLSSFLGKVWASRILEKDRLKYGKELEDTKSQYEKQLEAYKHELNKSQSLFLRYSEYQFKLYNELWNKLCKLKDLSDNLWEESNLKNAQSFILHLEKTIASVEKNRLLIEDDHFQRLIDVLDSFANFKVGKKLLTQMNNLSPEDISNYQSDDNNLESAIQSLISDKQNYDALLDEIAKSFKKQLRTS